MIDYVLLYPVLLLLRVVRRTINTTGKLYVLLNTGPMQPLLSRIGKLKAYEAYLNASQRTPAYKQFLAHEKHRRITKIRNWENIPITHKENYVKAYSIEARCRDGKIPTKGVIIDESSGSSGTPNNWVRGAYERRDVKRVMQLALGLTFKNEPLFILNCFALGPWATGMNVSMSLVDVGILKSIGPDKAKLENALKLFGPKYHYLVAGYPPFIKNFVDTTTLDLTQYHMELTVGGEAISEGLRDYLLQYFHTVRSSYGASDLEINIGAETDLAIALRKQLDANPEACQELFGKSQPPMLFQYDPLDYYIETTPENELVYTITRFHNVAPKIRYNLHDIGAIYTYRQLTRVLQKHGINVAGIHAPHSKFPFLCVYGRGDLTVPFYGAKIFTNDIDKIINDTPQLVTTINCFQLKSYDDAKLNRRLRITLEQSQNHHEKLQANAVRQLFYDGLVQNNQDFREVTKMFTIDSIEIELCDFGTGPFADRDIRVKNKYIAS